VRAQSAYIQQLSYNDKLAKLAKAAEAIEHGSLANETVLKYSANGGPGGRLAAEAEKETSRKEQTESAKRAQSLEDQLTSERNKCLKLEAKFNAQQEKMNEILSKLGSKETGGLETSAQTKKSVQFTPPDRREGRGRGRGRGTPRSQGRGRGRGRSGHHGRGGQPKATDADSATKPQRDEPRTGHKSGSSKQGSRKKSSEQMAK
jgi:hypothetical protein